MEKVQKRGKANKYCNKQENVKKINHNKTKNEVIWYEHINFHIISPLRNDN